MSARPTTAAALTLAVALATALATACRGGGRGSPGLASRSVLRLEREAGGPCLAVLVAPREALTARHCVQDREASQLGLRGAVDGCDARVLEVIGGEAGGTPGDLSGQHAVADAARLLLAEPLDCAAPIPVAPAAVAAAGAGVWFAGTPGAPPTPARVIAADSGRIVTELVTAPGDSGGPLVDGRGRLLGIASYRGRNASVFVPVPTSAAASHRR